MQLSNKVKTILKDIGVPEDDFEQIRQAMRYTNYEYHDKRIGRKEAIELLGDREFWSGAARSAFHWTACRTTASGEAVYFDSSRYFKG